MPCDLVSEDEGGDRLLLSNLQEKGDEGEDGSVTAMVLLLLLLMMLLLMLLLMLLMLRFSFRLCFRRRRVGFGDGDGELIHGQGSQQTTRQGLWLRGRNDRVG